MENGQSQRLVLTGDSIITRRLSGRQHETSRMLGQYISEASIAFTNLEVLPNDFRGYPAVESGGTHLAAHGWVIDELQALGFDVFACANNHALDYSIEGLVASVEALEGRGVPFAGIGRTLSAARMPAYVDCGDTSVAVISCASTFAKGQEAGEQSADMQGRPGLSPLRFDTVYEVERDQLEALRNIATDLGLEEQRLGRIQMGFAFPPDDPELFHLLEPNLGAGSLLDAKFRIASKPAVRTSPRRRDVDAITRWVRDARLRADTVVVSLHGHEQGRNKEEPAEFMREFAREVIGEGADVVVGHGPHLLRGMEVHEGRPIFYSLGNFVAQNELVYKLPMDAYDRFRVDPGKTPSEVFLARTQNDQKSFPADKRYWQTVMPVCDLVGGRIADMEIVPVTLGHGEAARHRGRPSIAQGEEAEDILSRFKRLSEDLGTEFDVAGGEIRPHLRAGEYAQNEEGQVHERR